MLMDSELVITLYEGDWWCDGEVWVTVAKALLTYCTGLEQVGGIKENLSWFVIGRCVLKPPPPTSSILKPNISPLMRDWFRSTTPYPVDALCFAGVLIWEESIWYLEFDWLLEPLPPLIGLSFWEVFMHIVLSSGITVWSCCLERCWFNVLKASYYCKYWSAPPLELPKEELICLVVWAWTGNEVRGD